PDDYAVWTLTFHVTSSSANVMLLIGGHTAVGTDPVIGWGTGLGSGSVSGGPYHFKWTAADGASVGNRDNQIQSGALVPPTPTTHSPLLPPSRLLLPRPILASRRAEYCPRTRLAATLRAVRLRRSLRLPTESRTVE